MNFDTEMYEADWHPVFNPPPPNVETPTYRRYADQYERALRQVWDKKHRKSLGGPVICMTCGGPNVSSCGCAYERWRATLGPQQIFDILKDHEDRETEEIRKRIEQYNRNKAKLMEKLDNAVSIAYQFHHDYYGE